MQRVLTSLVLLLSMTFAAADEDGPTCDVINDPDVKYIDIRLPENEVPENMTTYVCQTQNIPLPLDVAYHAVAFEPIIANKDVMHHMILFGCPDVMSNEPHECGGADGLCRTFLVQWSMGIKGQICSFPDAGVRFGRGSLQSLALQIHWNNAKLQKGLIDSSGVRIYYTTHLRKYDLGNVQIGQNHLVIPPGSAHAASSGSCSPACTREWLKHPIYFTRAHLHMHYVGDGGIMELYRDGNKVTTIMEDKTYDYNSPPAHYFDQPVEILPGDEVRVTCYFNTKDGVKARNTTVFWGEGSDGEMCYAFITYYPKVNDFDQCIQYDDYDMNCQAAGVPDPGECIVPIFMRNFMTTLSGEILEHCTSPGVSSEMKKTRDNNSDSFRKSLDARQLCTAACEKAVKNVIDHPCMKGDIGQEILQVQLPGTDSWKQVKVILDAAALHCAD